MLSISMSFSLGAALLASLTHANPIRSVEPRQAGCGSHGPGNRACWNGDFNLDSDFEILTPPQGKLRTFDFTLSNLSDVAPDGVHKPAMLINNQFPGPTIEADWGDFVQIHVHNQLQHNGTSFHWHGMHLRGHNDQDGANGVTECPIPPGQSKTYSFQLTQYGTSWYHSHFSAQYGNGVAGAIQINGPASADYDIDLGPYVISDWYYETADRLERQAELVSNGGPPPPSDNILFNGKNINPRGGGGGQYQKTRLTPGKKHRLRLINTSVDNTFTVSLVGHNFTVIATDLVPVKPVVKDSLFMTVGQRYDVIIEADKKTENYWFNATLGGGGLCGVSRNPHPAAVFFYDGAPDRLPVDQGTPPAGLGCADSTGFTPVLARTAPKAEFDAKKQVLDVALGQPEINGNKVFRWTVNGSDMDVQWDKPTLEYIAEGNTSWPRRANIIEIPEADAWTWWIIENASPVPHPIHLHGHDFLLLGTGAGSFAGAGAPLNFENPVRRDVAQLPGSGWMVIAFRTDNPGAWLMHCHIAWHVSMGLSVQFLERGAEIAGSMDLASIAPTCDAWRKYYPTAQWPKHDSGL
ncbi:Putative multicopper oxidase, second cupredoxin domain, multicopper oxidase, copper-binding protein [Colletotrichum destructivum]|uniref:laccase n=1 Tax=Colletotrichum destructivum TaxID=34406 RepID=A0AAX4J0L9_9PEZI|nr:Putative multicopper oxidase, second cupredoxin domain, multicopper oxidase, copper-binding protein [Colletotrichum destructivum]